jgi:hypothetical protein
VSRPQDRRTVRSRIPSKTVNQNARRTSGLRQTESAFRAILVLGVVGPGLRKEVTWMKITVEIDRLTLVLLVLNILAFLRYR